MAHSDQTWAAVERMKAEGLSDPEISRRTSIPRSTIYMHFRREAGPERTASSDDLGLLASATAFLGSEADAFVGAWRRLDRPAQAV
jgi:hypothetical protein